MQVSRYLNVSDAFPLGKESLWLTGCWTGHRDFLGVLVKRELFFFLWEIEIRSLVSPVRSGVTAPTGIHPPPPSLQLVQEGLTFLFFHTYPYPLETKVGRSRFLDNCQK